MERLVEAANRLMAIEAAGDFNSPEHAMAAAEYKAAKDAYEAARPLYKPGPRYILC